MKSKKIKTVAQLLIVVCLVAFALSTNSCNKKDKREIFRIKLDSITFEGVRDGYGFTYKPATITVEDSIVIRLYGKIGPNQCYVLDRDPPVYFDSIDASKIICEPEGRKIDDGICMYKEGESFLDHIVIIVFKDPYTDEPLPGVYAFYDYTDPDTKLLEIEVK